MSSYKSVFNIYQWKNTSKYVCSATNSPKRKGIDFWLGRYWQQVNLRLRLKRSRLVVNKNKFNFVVKWYRNRIMNWVDIVIWVRLMIYSEINKKHWNVVVHLCRICCRSICSRFWKCWMGKNWGWLLKILETIKGLVELSKIFKIWRLW